MLLLGHAGVATGVAGVAAKAELIARVQGLAIAAGLEQPVGAAITMAATAMARSNA